MKRRAVLKQAGVLAGTITVAGCLSENGGGGGGGGSGGGTDTDATDAETDTETPTDAESATDTATSTDSSAMAVASRDIETTDTGCGSENAASVEFTDGGASITGSVAASDPCHDAAFADVVVDGDAMTVVVEAVAADGGACQQCLGQISYAARVETENGVPQSVTVEHRSQGETTQVAEASR